MNIRKATFYCVAGLILVGPVVAFVVGRQLAAAGTPTETCDLEFSNGATLYRVPVAKTAAQEARGLMHKTDVGPGMLFTWEKPEPRVFWMRNTPAPLTIGFFDTEGVLFSVEDMEPNSETNHFSFQPAVDALELAQGEYQRLGLSVGSALVRRKCR
ncbi:DUF192 domain-containing protein [Pseudomonas sp. LPH60]|uniref:DUF192 domain-containing protein n=1 Tax=Pseudomonas sp. LPH60 TaxID=3065906 RepID=UPI00273BCE1D|nr:DUF192 domain-containing protein [Pseudomonas sp. LPH60]MDP4573464.1 DUF192 domain-containing protein [Pseudomonas sp. LPH60]